MTKPALAASDIATTPSGMRLQRRHYRRNAAAVAVHNASDGFKLIMPTCNARVRLDREADGIFEGAVCPGTVRFVQPDECARLTALTSIQEVILYVPGTIFRSHASIHGFDVAGSLCPQLSPVIAANYGVGRIVPLLDLAVEAAPIRRQALIEGLAASLLALLLERDIHRSQNGSQALDEEQFERIIRFADERLSRHLDLAEWAGAVELSPGEFARRFQQHTRVAPYTWFMDRRIDEAKRLLTRGDMPLVEIALEAGFCSQSHFTEAFRRRIGTSPGRWRRSR